MFVADQLLNPISDNQPAGEDLSFAPELDAIAKARKFDDPSLDQGEWVTELKEADWDFVVKSCSALLEKRTKDLRLAVWLSEAGAKKHHMRGLAEGLLVLAGLLDDYWDIGLYPESDGDDHDQRIGNLSWILSRIPALLKEMPVTDGNGKRYTTLDFDKARKNPNDPDNKLSDMDSAKRANSPQFRSTFAADALYLMEALLKFEKSADERLGRDSPGFSAARDAVSNMMHLMPTVAAVAVDDVAPAGEQYGTISNDQGMPYIAPQGPSGPPGAITNRAQALAQLRAVAEFFRRTEPHSPVSYFADKAADAGQQNLHDWLRSVVKDEASMAHIEELLGVKSPE
ncbi:type VI secretion system protein TssA [Massilia sp. PAMC28688]|uniref:type VI secretion system protein TssA n=1 Tax=Massilia sp. PAMC28688 TaxID=2861283 RepID=UPI001C62ED7F|nr:type VI secretion system protein TssA [Massilia sp. PAMC28688]QYF92749.1 type VI secretion system protein TssA [Massilia sp. PAMC28688]